MAFATRKAPYKNWEKYSPYSVHLRRKSFGANLDSSGNVRIYRALGDNQTCLVIEQADTTNNPTALVVKNSGTGVGIDVSDVNTSGTALKATIGAAASGSITGSIKILSEGDATRYIATYSAV
jgi:hypothetical protein